MARGSRTKKTTDPELGYEAQLWKMADALRNNMDAAEYKHVVLGLIFLRYISDAFEAKHAELAAEVASGADPEDPDEYRAASIFWVPKEARWSHLKASAPQPTIGTIVDDAMAAIERDNPSLKGVLPKDYARPNLDKQRLGQLIGMVSNIEFSGTRLAGAGDEASRSKDRLGQVYEYFLAQFASAEGKKGGQFYTPSHVVRVLVEMLAPYPSHGTGGRAYDHPAHLAPRAVDGARPCWSQLHRAFLGNDWLAAEAPEPLAENLVCFDNSIVLSGFPGTCRSGGESMPTPQRFAHATSSAPNRLSVLQLLTSSSHRSSMGNRR